MTQQKFLNRAFNIAEDPWWRPHYCDPQGVDSLVDNIICLHKIVKNEMSSDDPFWIGCTLLHHRDYLKECIAGEQGSSVTLTSEDIDGMIDGGILIDLLYLLCDRRKFRQKQKVLKLHDAVRHMFPEIFPFRPPDMTKFDVKYVKSVHRLVGAGIIPDAGDLRTKPAKPARDIFIYLAPELIEQRLEELLEECRQAFADPHLNVTDAVKYGACFLENFLYIHPFSNGNGRVGRLLLSYLLTNHTVVPLSLYSEGNKRNVYLQCLRECRQFHAEFKRPASLARFILENIEREFIKIHNRLDLPFY